MQIQKHFVIAKISGAIKIASGNEHQLEKTAIPEGSRFNN